MKAKRPKQKRPDETICQFALRILKPIPKDKWITDRFTDNIGRCCAIGHFTRITSSNPNDFGFSNCSDWHHDDRTEVHELRKKTCEFLEELGYNFSDISTVNNCPTINGFTEKEIKDRVIHLLNEAVKKGY